MAPPSAEASQSSTAKEESMKREDPSKTKYLSPWGTQFEGNRSQEEPKEKRAKLTDPSGVKRQTDIQPEDLKHQRDEMDEDKAEMLLEFFELEDCPEVQIPMAKMKRAMKECEADTPKVDAKLSIAFGDALSFETPKHPKSCHRFGLTPGVVLDIRRNWNFNEQSDRDTVLEQIKWEKPMLIMGADRGSPKSSKVEHVKFLNEVYKAQTEIGGLFVHEQANRSKMKDSQWIQEMLYEPNVQTVQQGASTYASNSKILAQAIDSHVVVTKTDIDQAVIKGLREELLQVGFLQEFEAGGPTVEEKDPAEEW